MNTTRAGEPRGDAGRATRLARVLDRAGSSFQPASRAASEAADWAMAQTPSGTRLLVVPSAAGSGLLADFDGERGDHDGAPFLVGPPTARNAAALRRHLPWLEPRPLPPGTSAGFGDRLGLATPGHVRALQAVGGSIAPVFAQQSIREMTRTARSPRAVIDDATSGGFEAGWQEGQGADADHL